MAANRSRRALIKHVNDGPVTLVLGAGISIGRGVPSWWTLVRKAYEMADIPAPDWLDSGPMPHPLALQIALEEVEASAREAWRRQGIETPVSSGAHTIADFLRSIIYDSVPARVPSARIDSLRAIADAIRADQRGQQRRILRVITYNADDLLEREANRGSHERANPVVWPIARASGHVRTSRGAHGRPPIPVYHVHGYLRRDAQYDAQDTLIFTDAQYWDSIASPMSFANRVMAAALHDSHCVFIGLSMTDLNIMRWLGVRHNELVRDKMSQCYVEGRSELDALAAIGPALNRHFWIRTATEDSTQLISRHLERRGVSVVAVDDWQASFAALLRECFGTRS